MNLRISALMLLCAATATASFSASPNKEATSAKAAHELARALQGRTAGQPVSCIANFRGQARMEVIDDRTILFRDGGTLYVQRPRGGCRGLDDGGYALVTRLPGSQQLCSGDINQLVDLSTGVYGGHCVYSEFVPYRKVK